MLTYLIIGAVLFLMLSKKKPEVATESESSTAGPGPSIDPSRYGPQIRGLELPDKGPSGDYKTEQAAISAYMSAKTISGEPQLSRDMRIMESMPANITSKNQARATAKVDRKYPTGDRPLIPSEGFRLSGGLVK